MPRPLALALIALCLLALAAPAQAGAKRSGSLSSLSLPPQAKFSLETGNGYSVSVEGSGRTVWLSVERGAGIATYTTRGRAWPGGIRARFGHFGRISVRLESSGRTRRERPPPWCKGRPALVRSGVFAGTIRFEGEDGYVSIDARRAKGRSSTRPRWRCDVPRRAAASARQKPRIEEASLEASLPKSRTSFLATGLHLRSGPSLIFFVAGTRERRGSVRIGRLALVISERARTFSFDGTRSATVRPPKPFRGSAEFERGPGGSRSWTGTLSVNLPGATVPLTGPAFKAKLTQPNAKGGPLQGPAGSWVSPSAQLRRLAFTTW